LLLSSGAIRIGNDNKVSGTMNFQVNGLWGLIVLVADIWAIVNIIQSGVTTGKKVLWTVLVILLPVLGFIIWLLAGPKSR
jgi:hypothetical protein